MKKITADSFLQFRFVSDPGFSPDGSKAAFVVQTPALRSNSYKSNLWLLDVKTKGLTQLTALGDAKAITRAKGIGAKTADRIVLELKDRIGQFEAASEVQVPATETVKNQNMEVMHLGLFLLRK